MMTATITMVFIRHLFPVDATIDTSTANESDRTPRKLTVDGVGTGHADKALRARSVDDLIKLAINNLDECPARPDRGHGHRNRKDHPLGEC